MKINVKQMIAHIFLGVLTIVLLFPIIFAIANSFKTLEEATNHIWRFIPLNPTIKNYIHVFETLPFGKITWYTF